MIYQKKLRLLAQKLVIWRQKVAPNALPRTVEIVIPQGPDSIYEKSFGSGKEKAQFLSRFVYICQNQKTDYE